MNVEYDKSFLKWLTKIDEPNTLKKIEHVILMAEKVDTIKAIKNTRKLNGHKNYYRIKIGDYRIGFGRISSTTIRFFIVANRKDIY